MYAVSSRTYPQKPTQLFAINSSRFEIKPLHSNDYDHCLSTTKSEQSNVDGKQKETSQTRIHLIKLRPIYSPGMFIPECPRKIVT